FCGTYSEDGNIFMSACQDGMLRLYDARGSEFRLTAAVQARDVGWAIVDTCYSPDQHFLIYSSWSHFVHLITLDGSRHEALDVAGDLAQAGSVCPFSIRFSNDSREIIGGTNHASIFIYDCVRDTRPVAISAHEDDVNAVAFLDDSSNLFVTGSDDCLCKVWDRRIVDDERDEPVGVFRGHSHGITYIDPKGDGRHFISQSKDCSIKLWDLRRVCSARHTAAPRVALSDYRWGISGRPQRQLRDDTSLMTYRDHVVARTLIRARFSPEFSTGQKYIYSGSANGCIYVYDSLTGKVASRLKPHADTIVRDVSWHPFKPYIVSS
ncbi:uncharacterized protein MONBRDRAFT_1381, partial [Monosiga brevicollis MX1]